MILMLGVVFVSSSAGLHVCSWFYVYVEQFVLIDPLKPKLSKFGGFCNFARKSFSSSFEHLFKVCSFCFVTAAIFCTFKFDRMFY